MAITNGNGDYASLGIYLFVSLPLLNFVVLRSFPGLYGFLDKLHNLVGYFIYFETV